MHSRRSDERPCLRAAAAARAPNPVSMARPWARGSRLVEGAPHAVAVGACSPTHLPPSYAAARPCHYLSTRAHRTESGVVGATIRLGRWLHASPPLLASAACPAAVRTCPLAHARAALGCGTGHRIRCRSCDHAHTCQTRQRMEEKRGRAGRGFPPFPVRMGAGGLVSHRMRKKFFFFRFLFRSPPRLEIMRIGWVCPLEAVGVGTAPDDGRCHTHTRALPSMATSALSACSCPDTESGVKRATMANAAACTGAPN